MKIVTLNTIKEMNVSIQNYIFHEYVLHVTHYYSNYVKYLSNAACICYREPTATYFGC